MDFVKSNFFIVFVTVIVRVTKTDYYPYNYQPITYYPGGLHPSFYPYSGPIFLPYPLQYNNYHPRTLQLQPSKFPTTNCNYGEFDGVGNGRQFWPFFSNTPQYNNYVRNPSSNNVPTQIVDVEPPTRFRGRYPDVVQKPWSPSAPEKQQPSVVAQVGQTFTSSRVESKPVHSTILRRLYSPDANNPVVAETYVDGVKVDSSQPQINITKIDGDSKN